MGRLADLRATGEQVAGSRVLMDLRALQEPERAPLTATYLRRLLTAYAADPAPGESIVAILRVLRPDPLAELVEAGLPVASRRWLPPTGRALGGVGLALDRPLLRGAVVRPGGPRTEPSTLPEGPGRPGSSAVFHTAGGAVPAASRLPVVASLLDLAPWELPERYARTAAGRFGQRQRAAALLSAARVLVGSRATAEAAERLLEIPADAIAVVPLAADDAIAPGPPDPGILARLRAAFGLPDHYLVVGGRWDARSDLPTLLLAVAALRDAGPPDASLDGDVPPWPPLLVLAGAAGHDPGGPSRVAALVERLGVADLVRLTSPLTVPELASLTAGSMGHVQPASSDATGLMALDALATGVPVVASRSGALPEVVGPAGIVVEPRDPARMAMAVRALWSGGSVAVQVRRAAAARAEGPRRRWADVARETREAYRAAAEGATDRGRSI